MSNFTDFIGGSAGYKIVQKSTFDATKEIELLSDAVIKDRLCKSYTFNNYGLSGMTALPWTQKTSGATTRHIHSAVTYNNGTDQIMVVFGGNNGGYLNDTWEYNITTDNYIHSNTIVSALQI